MNKKGLRLRTLVGCLTLATPCLAGAATPPDTALVGHIAALANFCSSLQPTTDNSAFMRELAQQFPAQTTLPEYQVAYANMSAALAKLGPHVAKVLCARTPPP